jgi:hypothetical protein
MFLAYLPIICYLTTRTWGIGGSILLVMVLVFFSSSLFSHFWFLLGSLVSSFGFSLLHFLFNKQGLGAEEVPFYWSWCLFLFILPSFHHFVFYLVPWWPLLVSIPWICYLTTRTWGIGGSNLLVKVLVFFSSSLFSHYWFLLGSLVSSFGFSPLHFLFNKQGLGA